MVPVLLLLVAAAWAQEDTGRPRGGSSLSGMDRLTELGQYEYVVEGVPQYLGHFDNGDWADHFVHMVEVSQVLRQPEPTSPVTRVMWAIGQGCLTAPSGTWTCSQLSGEADVRVGNRGVFFMTAVQPEHVPKGLQRAVEAVPLVFSHYRFYELPTAFGPVCHVETGGGIGYGGPILWIDQDGAVKGVTGRIRDEQQAKLHASEVGADAWVRDESGKLLGLKYSIAVDRIRIALSGVSKK